MDPAPLAVVHDGPRTTMRAGDASLVVDADDGARICSLTIDGEELLHTTPDHDDPAQTPISYGSFVMAPWAGRIRGASAFWQQARRRLPAAPDGHGLHGLVYAAAWTRVADDRWQVQVDDQAWFAPVTITQRLHLQPDHLALELTASCPVPTPVTLGWHPWWRRHLQGHEARITLPAGARMRVRDDDGIATAEEVAVPPGPWDDTFVGLDGPVVVTWGDHRTLTLDSDGPATVVFTGRDHAVCVEPQTGPPDEVHGPAPQLAGPDHPVTLRARWSWR